MSIWALRGLRGGIVTTRWPARPDEYADSWHGPATVQANSAASVNPEMSGAEGAATFPDISGNGHVHAAPGLAVVETLCPTGAIEAAGRLHVDQGRCILCGRCVAARPDLFAWSPGATGPAAAAVARQALVVPEEPETDAAVEAARAALAARTAALRRSVHVRHVDAGSDGTEEWEIQALLGPVYDIHRLGVFFTASPRHADVLLVTGAGTVGMTGPLRVTYEGMPDPKVVIAVGTDAVSGGLLSDRLTGVDGAVPVDVWVPGSPPSPFGIVNALLLATGKLATAAGVRR
jgi:Ni,Fe-hydrogenase III small subunit/ferredoxin